MTFQEYCAASTGPYAGAGYTCTCDEDLQAVVCGAEQEDIYRYIVLMYDDASQGHGSGIDCICGSLGCETAGNVCIQIFTNVNGEPYCMMSDIAVSGSACNACSVCPLTGEVYRVEVDECLNIGLGEDPVGCFSTALVPQQQQQNNDPQFDAWCSQQTAVYERDGFSSCECDGEESNLICSRLANGGTQIILLSYDATAQDTEAAIDCNCPDTSCEVSPSICHYVDSPESSSP
ncbi:MAG: hypothetical protein SGARI_006890, partial [Bacillariaceae sp.]